MDNNHFAHCPGANLTVRVHATLSGSHNVLEGGELTTIYLTGYPELNLQGNSILNGSEYTVLCNDYEPPPDHIIDLAHNYWGTTDPDQISEWIFDGFDSDQVHHYVRFAPILAAPVGVDGVPPVGPTLAVYPNPFNPRTEIVYRLDAASEVDLAVFDLAGRLVDTLETGAASAGRHSVTWAGKDRHGRAVPSGKYFARLEVGGDVVTRSMTLIR
jgi:hypothetical protein